MKKYCDICGTICLLVFFVSLLFLGGAIDADRTIWPWLGTFAGSTIGVFVFARLEERCQR